jgi:predicted nucleic acid-binding protein
VTGDKDLLRLKQYDSIRILKVSDFIATGITRDRLRDRQLGRAQM